MVCSIVRKHEYLVPIRVSLCGSACPGVINPGPPCTQRAIYSDSILIAIGLQRDLVWGVKVNRQAPESCPSTYKAGFKIDCSQ